MSDIKIEPKWECDTCGEVHDFYTDAQACCAPEPRKVYCCPVCDEVHEDEASALDCCAADDEPANPYYIDPLVLEQAGQMRLPL